MCPHAHEPKEDVVLFFRCPCCGDFVPFRNPEDVKKRGIIASTEEAALPLESEEMVDVVIDYTV